MGLRTAIDDFGAGYAGLTLLSEYQPDIVKIDMELVRDVDRHLPKQAIVNGIVSICSALGIRVLAEGIESAPGATSCATPASRSCRVTCSASPRSGRWVRSLPAPGASPQAAAAPRLGQAVEARLGRRH